MSHPDQLLFHARLSRSVRHRIYFQKLGMMGQKTGKEYPWDDKGRSGFPFWIYLSIRTVIQTSIQERTDSEAGPTRKAALNGLEKAGILHGFSVRKDGDSVFWILNGHKVAEWQLHYGYIQHSREKQLRKSPAWYRFTIMIHNPAGEGTFVIKARKARDSK